MLLHGRVELDDLEDETEITLADGDYDTVAGYLLDRIGRVPAEKESHDLDGFRFTILKASPSRIELVRMMRL